VQVGDIVIFGNSLVGKISQVGNYTSQALHITDPKMRVAVQLIYKDSKEKCGEGICIGMVNYCKLELVEKTPENRDKNSTVYVLSSGFSGDYPDGLMIGKVELLTKAEENQVISTENSLFWNAKVYPKAIHEINSVFVIKPESINLSKK
jgi:cell shape-determining protein MreC